MNHEARDELIQKHLDGETSTEEIAQVTRLLAENASFRSRFFSFVNQVAWLRELMGPGKSESPVKSSPQERSKDMPAVMNPPVKKFGEPAESQGTRFDYRQIYFNAVLGGIGGLVSWIALVWLASTDWVADPERSIYQKDAVRGLLLGICIGAAIGCTDGLIASRSIQRLLLGAFFGAVLGAIGGLLGLPLGEYFFEKWQGGVWPRAFGWSIFGAFIGSSDGFFRRMPGKVCYGILGGFLGGLVGGSTFEALGTYARLHSSDPRSYNAALAWGSAIGLIFLGACIGALVGLVESILRKAWVRFTMGRLEGQTRTLDSSRAHTIGTSKSCSIVIPADETTAPIHAEIAYVDEDFVIRAREGKVIVRRNDVDKEVTDYVLVPGDRVQVGSSRMVFRNEEVKKS